jgi:hypothetical protein
MSVNDTWTNNYYYYYYYYYYNCYLTAANLNNISKSHLGTVYHFFSDLSDIGWREKRTVLLKLATHSMDKIVQVLTLRQGKC